MQQKWLLPFTTAASWLSTTLVAAAVPARAQSLVCSQSAVVRSLTSWLILISLTGLGAVAQAALNDTGIKTCSNATQNGLPCPVAGFPGQDAEYGTNSFNFTKLDANGNPLPVTATNHSCVKDNVTGLMFEVKTDDGGLRDKDYGYTWYNPNLLLPDVSGAPGSGGYGMPGGYEDACFTNGRCDTEKYIQDVNSSSLCGYTDWRLPVPQELISIGDYSTISGINDTFRNYFPNTPPYPKNRFWTQTTSLNYPFIWTVYGLKTDLLLMNYDEGGITAVRGEQTFPSLVQNGNGTITDQTTGLMWTQCPINRLFLNGVCTGIADGSNGLSRYLTWERALLAARNSRVGGYSDWRLPNVKELLSLIKQTTYASIDTAFLSDTGWFWTSTAASYSNPSNPSSFAVSITRGSSVEVRTIYRTYTTYALTVRSIPVPTAPTVITNAPSVITATSARLSGTVNPNNADTTANFDWGTTTDYGTNIAAIPSPIDANAGPTDVYADVTDLSCDTLYNYRVNAENSAGVSHGDNQSFTTAQCRTVTPIIGTGCAVNPNTPQTVSLGNTTSFTVTPNPGYAINPGVRGTCPQGSWNGNVWTTGAITANCTVNLYCTQIPKPDFTITGITLTPASPNAGGNFSAVVTVKNQSTTGAGDAGQLTIWTNQTTAQTCGAVGDQTVTVGPLATGAVKTITITGLVANNSLNTQTLRAFIDSECITAETNETNNQSTKTYRPIGVDLVVTSIALAPTSPLANNLVKATVTIKNQGNTAAYAGYLDVWANKSTPVSCGDDGDAWAEVGTVAANTTKTLILNVPVGTAGSKTARAFVDSWCGTPETVETNNQFTKTYTVR